MLPKSKKLNLSLEENKNVLRTKPVISEHFFIYRSKKETVGFAAAVVIPKKTLQKATARNRVKRHLYQVVAALESRIKTTRVVILMKKSPIKLNRDTLNQLKEELTLILQERL